MPILALNGLTHVNVGPWVWSQEEGLAEGFYAWDSMNMRIVK